MVKKWIISGTEMGKWDNRKENGMKLVEIWKERMDRIPNTRQLTISTNNYLVLTLLWSKWHINTHQICRSIGTSQSASPVNGYSQIIPPNTKLSWYYYYNAFWSIKFSPKPTFIDIYIHMHIQTWWNFSGIFPPLSPFPISLWCVMKCNCSWSSVRFQLVCFAL